MDLDVGLQIALLNEGALPAAYGTPSERWIQEAGAYPNPRRANLVRRAFLQQRPRKTKSEGGTLRFHDLADLYDA